MKHFDIREKELGSTILRWMVLATGVFALAFSLIEVFSFSLTNLAVLAVSIFVSGLVCKYEAKIPETSFIFAPRNVFAFWGIMWLGVPGGLIIGASASIASRVKLRGEKSASIAVISHDVLCILVSGFAYNYSLGLITSFEALVDSGNKLLPNGAAAAAFLMAFTYFLVNVLLSWVFHGFEKARVKDGPMREIFLLPAAAISTSLIATILLFVTFNHFGVEFGLVILPLAIIGNLSFKIHTRRLAQKTRQITEASRMHLATVEALATAIDARDQVGVGHVRRTQIYCVGIGNVLGLSEGDINALTTGALLHDIGKLAVPDHILNKPGKLTPAEMEKSKIHSSVGASILEKVGFPYPVVPTVKYHHEFWDGSGYPEQLKGSLIPLTARILTVADAYDTLRSARPYRPAVSREDACNFLRAGAGTQFDPKIVNTFLRNLAIFEEEAAAEGLSYEGETDGLNHPEHYLDDSASPNYVEQIKSANREVFTLYSLARDFSSSLNLQETLSLFSNKVGSLIPFDTFIVYLLDQSGEFATAVYASGENNLALRGKGLNVGQGATGLVLKEIKALVNSAPSLDFDVLDQTLSQEYAAMISLPLIADEKLIGAISLYSRDLARYQVEHLRLLETVSLIAADAIGNSLQHTEAANYALTDPMTGLPNARSLQIQFDKEVKRAGRGGTSFQVLVLDLDGFKAVNDNFGHKAGDKMLKEISGVIRGQLREYDFLARYGGDEFVAIVPEHDGREIHELCRRIESAVSEFVLPVGEDIFAKVGVSLGTASYPNHGELFDQIINAADKSMYRKKALRKQGKIDAGSANANSDEGLIVEIDATHIISSAAVN